MPASSSGTQKISKDPCYCLPVVDTFFSFCFKILWQPFYPREPERGKSVLASLPTAWGKPSPFTHKQSWLHWSAQSPTARPLNISCLLLLFTEHHLWDLVESTKHSNDPLSDLQVWGTPPFFHLLLTLICWKSGFCQFISIKQYCSIWHCQNHSNDIRWGQSGSLERQTVGFQRSMRHISTI